MELSGFNRLMEKLGGAQFPGLTFRFRVAGTGYDHYRNMLRFYRHPQFSQDFDAGAGGHIDIKHDGVWHLPQCRHPGL